jgi:uncharacterized protein YciI
MNEDKSSIQKTAPVHVNYWNEKSLKEYKGGPFADFSGGCITFESTSIGEANALIMKDPFILNNCLQNYWVKEWVVNKH